jgi:hypothetical protein
MDASRRKILATAELFANAYSQHVSKDPRFHPGTSKVRSVSSFDLSLRARFLI